MAAERPTRSDDITKVLLDQPYREKCEFEPSGKLKNGHFVIGRMVFLCHKPKKGHKSISASAASHIVANELREDWIRKNVYPMSDRSVHKKILMDYEQFKTLCKQEKNQNHNKSEDWVKKARQFNNDMNQNAYDIRAKDSTYQEKLEAECGVRMKDEDTAFYEDNCMGSYTATCNATVSTSWLRKKKRERSRTVSTERHRTETDQAEHWERYSKRLQYQEGLTPSNTYETTNVDPDFDQTPICTRSNRPPITTRSKSHDSIVTVGEAIPQEDIPVFPHVKVRHSRKTINENIMRCTVQCLADYKVSPGDLTGIIVHIANTIFNQNWEKENDSNEDESVNQSDTETDSNGDEPTHEETDAATSSKSKRRMSRKDLTYVFPSRRTINRYLEDASYLNLHMVAKHLLEKEDNVVTVGLDDTTKAAGHKLYDVKADHITIHGPSAPRKIMTTGYVENTSHAGKDAAAAYEFKLKCLALLSDSTVDDIKSSIDFWMSDRAGDCATLLDNLGIESNKIIKCCAHVILGVDHACDKVFRNIEQKIGVQKLLKVTAGEKVFTSPSTSVHTLAQIAIAKLLSPSHAAHSISMYNDYSVWMETQGIDHIGFKGFVSNRFGRIAEIAKEYLARRRSIIDFFDAVVDINSNKLVLAVSTYIQNDWFMCCSQVYEMLGDIVIFPLMDLIGIDNRDGSNTDRNWYGVRQFFKKKIPEMKKTRDECASGSTGKQRLYAAVLDEVIDTVERQLSHMSFFSPEANDDDNEIDEEKLQYAPLTNLGCESEFAKLDNRISMSGGSTTVQTHSQKNVVSTNKLLVDSTFTERTDNERKEQWKWARCSEEVTNVKKLEKDFLATVKNAKKLSVMKKEALKKKQSTKTLKLLDTCKQHAGPVTPKCIDILDKLSEKQLLAEVGYLRATIARDIRQMRRVKSDGGKFKMEKFSIEELRTSIRNAVQPEENVTNDVDCLLKNVL